MESLHEFNASTGTPSHVHAQPMPISIEDLVGHEQSCDAGAGWTGKGLQERGGGYPALSGESSTCDQSDAVTTNSYELTFSGSMRVTTAYRSSPSPME
jgi:hypothetical protein